MSLLINSRLHEITSMVKMMENWYTSVNTSACAVKHRKLSLFQNVSFLQVYYQFCKKKFISTIISLHKKNPTPCLYTSHQKMNSFAHIFSIIWKKKEIVINSFIYVYTTIIEGVPLLCMLGITTKQKR